MPDLLVLAGAALAGLLGTAHCVLMCGGIAAGFSLADRRPSLWRALQPNLGRLTGYALAGALAGGIGHGIVALADSDALRIGVRTLAGVALLLLALRVAGWRAPSPIDAPMRAALAPVQRLRARLRLTDTGARRFAAGMLWGWLPCGLSASVLTVAWLSTDALQGAAIMLAFGLGSLPAMTTLCWTGSGVGRRLLDRGLRPAAVTLVALAGLLTLASPWLAHAPHLRGVLASLGCGTAS